MSINPLRVAYKERERRRNKKRRQNLQLREEENRRRRDKRASLASDDHARLLELERQKDRTRKRAKRPSRPRTQEQLLRDVERRRERVMRKQSIDDAMRVARLDAYLPWNPPANLHALFNPGALVTWGVHLVAI